MPFASKSIVRMRYWICCLAFCCLTEGTALAIENFCAEGEIVDCRGECGGPARYDDCKICDGQDAAKDECGRCFGTGPGACGCDLTIKDLGCGCGKPGPSGCDKKCGSTKEDLGCGCGLAGPTGCDNKCGSTNKDLGCGCGLGAPSGCDNECGSTKTDVGCGCGLPGPSGCDTECGSNKVIDTCGVCGGNDSTCPSCDAFGINVMKWAQAEDVIGDDQTLENTLENYLGASLDHQQEQWKKIEEGRTSDSYSKDYAFVFQSASSTEYNRVIMGKESPACLEAVLKSFSYNSYSLAGHEVRYYDSSCNQVPAPSTPQPQECWNHRTWYSPISLNLAGQDLNQLSATVVNFPLGNGDDQRWYEWYASETMPLLVFDPENSQRIERASQLFGNWTFGGKPYAAMTTGAVATPWEHGFEALATLDDDGDGTVANEELAGLALWFDANRDGESQPGEVQKLEKAGVTKLFYGPTVRKSSQGHVVVSVGYERIVDGKSVNGSAVDWFARGSDSKVALLTDSAELTEPVQSDESNNAPSSLKDFGKVTRWKWVENVAEPIKGAKPGRKAHGTFVIAQSKEGAVAGVTALEFPVGQSITKETNARSVIQMLPLKGVTVRGNPNKMGWDVVHGISTTHSEVQRVNETTLKGTSKLHRNDGSAEGTTITYSWTATLVE